MASDKGKAADRNPDGVVITPEAMRVLLDAIQALTLAQPAPASTSPSTPDGAGTSAASSSGLTSMPTTSGSASSNAADVSTSSSSPRTSPNVAPAHHGFHCSTCGAYNVGQSMAAWYVITAGRQVGVFSSWSLVQPHVTGVAHACFRRYPNLQAAQQAYNQALAAGLVCVLP